MAASVFIFVFLLTLPKFIKFTKIFSSEGSGKPLNGSEYGGCNGDILTYPSNWPNSYYYTRYCRTNRGLTVATDGFASNEALERTAYILDNMMANMDSAIPDIMDRSGFRQIVMGSYPSEIVPDLPELSFLDPAIWGTRRGSGATVQIPVGTNAEEDALCLDNDIYKDQDITVHEFAHSLHLLGFKQLWPEFQTELDQHYNYAYANSLWGWGYVGSYAMTNSEEYFAMGVQSYFDVQWPYDYEAPTNRDQLFQKDPNFASFIDRWMYNNEWRGGCP